MGAKGVLKSRATFDTFWWSLITVFQVIGGENWNEAMYDGIQGIGFKAAFYFVSLFVIGNYILLNLFLAILLSNFGTDEDETPEIEDIYPEEIDKSSESEKHNLEEDNELIVSVPADENPGPPLQDRPPTPLSAVMRKMSISNVMAKISGLRKHRKGSVGVHVSKVQSDELANRSLFVFERTNQVREYLLRLVAHRFFEAGMMVVIVWSTAVLALAPSLEDGSTAAEFFFWADRATTIIFTIEMVAKIIAFGFVLHP
eukprot:424463_1